MSTAELHYELSGPVEAPVVVLSNSIGTDLTMWDAQLPSLAERFRVLRYDHRGQGASPVPPAPYTLADLGGDLLVLLDRLGIGAVRFAGLSLGGMVGQWLAAHAPERVERLAACCTSARLGPPEKWSARAATVREQGTATITGSTMETWFTPAFREHHAEETARFAAMLARSDDAGYAACCGVIEHMDLRGDLPSITAPTLVLAGADDPATPPEHAREIADGIGENARVEVLPHAAHLATAEQAAEATRLLLDHFE